MFIVCLFWAHSQCSNQNCVDPNFEYSNKISQETKRNVGLRRPAYSTDHTLRVVEVSPQKMKNISIKMKKVCFPKETVFELGDHVLVLLVKMGSF